MDEQVGSRRNPVQKVRGVVFHPEGVILMRRIRKSLHGKGNVEYYVLPGGGREIGETLEQSLVREVQEEVGVLVRVERQIASLKYSTKQENIFECRYLDGEVGTGTGPEFTPARIKQRGLYIAEVVPLNHFTELDIKPARIKDLLVKTYGPKS